MNAATLKTDVGSWTNTYLLYILRLKLIALFLDFDNHFNGILNQSSISG